MSALEGVVSELAAEIGVGPMPIEPGMPAVFRLERSGRLFIEARDRRILVYLELPEPVRGGRQLEAALAACDPRRRPALPLRAGLTGDDRLVLGVTFEEPAFTLQALHKAIELLVRLQVELGA